MTKSLISDFKEMMQRNKTHARHPLAKMFAKDDMSVESVLGAIMDSPQYKALIASLDKPEAKTEIRATANKILREAGEKGFKLGFEAGCKPEAIDKADGWIKWPRTASLTDLPIDGDVVVEVKRASGRVQEAKVSHFQWSHRGGSLYNSNIIAYRIVEEKKPEKQTYKLSDMYVGWWRVCMTGTVQKSDHYYLTLEVARGTLGGDEYGTLIAITRADATEFYEGENLEREGK